MKQNDITYSCDYKDCGETTGVLKKGGTLDGWSHNYHKDYGDRRADLCPSHAIKFKEVEKTLRSELNKFFRPPDDS